MSKNNFDLKHLATVTSDSKPDVEPLQFELYQGISDSNIDLLIKYSQEDPIIYNNTSDGTRFTSRESFAKWQEKTRFPYTLVNQNQELVGIIWFGPKIMNPGIAIDPKINPNDYGITFSIRLYEPARGKRVSVPFIKAAFSQFLKSPEYNSQPNQNFWLETTYTNGSAVNIYEAFGFQHISLNKADRILMVYKPL